MNGVAATLICLQISSTLLSLDAVTDHLDQRGFWCYFVPREKARDSASEESLWQDLFDRVWRSIP